jgi:predicted O-methyltransferase YrrM
MPAPRHLARELKYTLMLRALPPRVAWFHWRARRLAWRTEDRFSLASATRPADLSLLLELARGRRSVAELGTATAWTSIALALADPHRSVITYDPSDRPQRRSYLELAGPRVRSRIELVTAPGSVGPPDARAVDLLYIDSSHDRLETISELEAWWTALRPGARVVFDDYIHPEYPGVRQAIEELGLAGEQQGTLYVHEVGGGSADGVVEQRHGDAP